MQHKKHIANSTTARKIVISVRFDNINETHLITAQKKRETPFITTP